MAEERGGSATFLEGGGELGAVIRALDWSATSLGPPERWPAALKSALRAMLDGAAAQPGPAAASQNRAASLLMSMGEAFVVLDRDLRIVEINEEGLRLSGRPASEMLGRKTVEVWPAEAGTPVAAAYRQVLETGEPAMLQQCWASPDGPLWFDIRIYSIDDGLAAFYRDITATKRAEEALRESEQRFRIAQEAGGIGTYDWNLVTGELYASDVARRLWGVAADTHVTIAMAVEMIHPEDRPFAMPVSRRPMEELVGSSEYRIIRADTGEVRWLARHVEIVRSPDGRPTRVIGAFRDITEHKRFAAHQQLLINELNHRVKNTLATVQSIAAQTMRNTPTLTAAQDAFEARLLALSKAHDVLTRQNWEGAGLREIVEQAMAAYRTVGEQRLSVDGPDVRLPPQMALAMAMALQELATNAVKYGSLSHPQGRVDVRWSIDAAEAGPRLRLRWGESGGPAVEAPARRGFGSRLIERGLAQQIGGEVRMEFAATGVVCTVDAPLERTAR